MDLLKTLQVLNTEKAHAQPYAHADTLGHIHEVKDWLVVC